MPTTTQNLCYNCFARRESTAGPCPYCGFDLAENQQKFPVALRAGTVLNDRYIIGRVLGQGGFGITYLAFDTQLQAKVAVKEYMPSDIATRVDGTTVSTMMETRSEDFTYGAERFQEEARTLAKFIGHPNIAGVSSYFDQNDTSYFVMDYIEGVSFKNYIVNNGGKVSVDETLNVMIPVLRALTAVHAEGFIHRDVTPDNIYISKDGNVKLLDFGSARYSIGDKSKSLDVILKVGYAPKEQYIRRGRQGPYTDVYSCAACFYAALTGFLPPESLERMDEDTLVPVSQSVPDIPEWLDKVILKGLAVQPEDRFQSTAEFLDAIENQLVVDVPSAVPAAQPEKKKPKTALIAGIAAALALAVGVGIFMGGRGGGDAVPTGGDPNGGMGFQQQLLKAEVPSITIQGEEYSTDLTGLELNNKGLTDEDIRDLKYMVNLSYINLNDNDLTDLSPLSELPRLMQINVNNNRDLSDLSPLSGLSELRMIYFQGCSVEDYSFMAGLENLEVVHLYCPGEDVNLSFLSNLTNVKSIYYYEWNGSGNIQAPGLSDISFLRGMTGLQEITLKISADVETLDLSPLSGLTELRTLYLYSRDSSNYNKAGAAAADLSPLSELTKLEVLQLTAAPKSLDALAGLTNLRTLSLTHYIRTGGGDAVDYTLADIGALRNMAKLNQLDLQVAEGTDLSPLSGSINLTELNLVLETAPKDLTFVENLTRLQTLHLAVEKGLESYHGLENLTDLRTLYLSGTAGVQDTAPLSELKKLTSLTFAGPSNDGVTLDLSGLSGLTGLQELNVNRQVASLEPLRGLTDLRAVYMYSAADYDKPIQSLDAFSGLTKLRSLGLGYVAAGVDTAPVSQVTELNIQYR